MRARGPNSSHWTRQVRKRRHYHRQWSGSNSWPIKCHRIWTRELATSSSDGSQLSKYNSTCWRWKIITSQLLMLLIRWTFGTTQWTFMTNCPSSLKTFLLHLHVRRTLKAIFLCAACLLLVAETKWPSHCKCELNWNWTIKYWQTQAWMPLCELWNFNFHGIELQIS